MSLHSFSFSYLSTEHETATQHVAKLFEKFYFLGNPETACQDNPYTGKHQIVPFLNIKE